MENDQALHEYIVSELAEHRRESDIAQAICERSGMYWSDAEAWVREVALLEAKTIRKRRSPALVALAVVTFLGGMALLILAASLTVTVITFYRATQPEMLSTLNILMLIANEASSLVWLSGLGLAMMLGSLWGMRDVWSDWLP